MEPDCVKQHSVIIVAGGIGTRMQADMPKQFMELCGKPILMHSIMAFAGIDKDIQVVVVLPKSQINYWQELCRRYTFTIPHRIAKGGETRFHSVKNGLALLSGEGLVAVHDGVRPLVSCQTVDRCFLMAERHGNAVPVVQVIDSVREVPGNGKSRVVDRSKLRLVQTPQVFDIVLLKKAYEQEYTSVFTDDASVFEEAGYTICLTEGNVENIKITTPHDLLIAGAFLKANASKILSTNFTNFH